MKQLGDRLRDLRESRNLKQTDVANHLCISNKILSSYERNISMPPIDTLKALCEYFNISADELLEIKISKDESLIKGTSPVLLSREHEKILSYYDRLNPENKEAIRGLMILYYKEQLRRNEA